MSDTRLQVLAALDETDVPVSGPALADRLGISRAAVWKHVEALRAEGFTIASDEGYCLEAMPAFGETVLGYGLAAPFDIEFHDTIDSTNRRGRDLAEAGASDVVVVADRQTAARGRLDRDWDSPPGGVYLSLVLRPDVAMVRAPLFTLAASVATARAAQQTGLDAQIKWPNDVVVPDPNADHGYRKLAGILTEVQGEADRVDWLVVGIGVNVHAADRPAAAALEEGGPVDRRVVVQTLLRELDALRGDLDAVLPAWRERSLTLGQRVRVETPGGTVVGDAVDVEGPGTLVVRTDEELVRVSAGDCEHLRPT